MVLEMPCPNTHLLFVASSLDDHRQAETEIVAWASVNGYRVPQPDRIFTLFSSDLRAREWRLLERSLMA